MIIGVMDTVEPSFKEQGMRDLRRGYSTKKFIETYSVFSSQRLVSRVEKADKEEKKADTYGTLDAQEWINSMEV